MAEPVPTCGECGCTPGVRPRECASCLDFVIEEGLALKAEVEKLKAPTRFWVLRSEYDALAAKLAEVEKERNDLKTYRRVMDSRMKTIHQALMASMSDEDLCRKGEDRS